MILKAIQHRRSVREFKPDPVPEDIVQELIKAAQFAPTSKANRAMEFVVIKDMEVRRELYKLAKPKQEFVKAAPLLIVPATNPEETGQPVPDLSLATENIFLQATELGLGSVWKNLKPPEAAGIKKFLKIPANMMIINIICLGYPAEMPAPHTDEDFETNKIHPEKWTK